MSLIERLSQRRWPLLLALGVLFLILSGLYNVKVPVYETPDEPSHVAYVDSLQRTGRIPDINGLTYQAWQPPLYHAVGAGVLKVLGLEPPLAPVTANPKFPNEDKRAFITPPGDSFPYRGQILSIHVLRALSAVFGLGTVVFVYLTAELLFPQRRLLVWTATAVAALLPQFLFISAAVSNDTAAAFFAAATVYFGLRFLRSGDWRPLLVASLLGSLAALSKASAALALLVPAVALLVRPMPWPRRFAAAFMLAALPLLMAGWFYYRNYAIGGDLSATEALREAGGICCPSSLTDPMYREIFFGPLRRSYWFAGGWFNIWLPAVVYDFIDLVTGIALGGLVFLFVRRGLTPFQRCSLSLMALLPLATLAGIFYHSVTLSFQTQGRHLFVAQPALVLYLVLGLATVLSPREGRDSPLLLLFPLCLLGLNAGILWITLPAAYG